jgi:hypothetical protein
LERSVIPGRPATGRFTRHLKAAILSSIGAGHISIPEALERYGLSADELTAWMDSKAAHGIDGLRAKFQRLRRKAEIGRVYRWFRQPDGALVRRPERAWHRARLKRAA